MRRLLSNRNVERAVFDVADFDGEWLDSFGRPELKGTWTIYGTSGSGKTTFALMLCKYLSGFRKTMYDSLEQGLSRSMQLAWNRTGVKEAGKAVVFGDKEPLADLVSRLKKPKSPHIVLIDSITAMPGFRKADYAELTRVFPHKLFIFIAHEKNHKAHPAVAEHIRCLSDVKIHIEGFKAFVTSRFEDAEAGEGGKDFIIWKQGADEYWPAKL